MQNLFINRLQGLLVYALLVGLVSTTSSVFASSTLEFPGLTSEKVVEYFSPIHFMGGGNDFVGGFFGLATKDNTTPITLGGETITCRRQIVGFYFNGQRGNRLWPLDADSLTQLRAVDTSYNNLTINGGLYTNCEGPGVDNVYTRYGMISYTQGGTTSHLIAGTKINLSANTYTPSFGNSLENFDNKSLVGFLYDTVGGWGFLGGVLNQTCYSAIATDINNNMTINKMFDIASDGKITYKANPTCTLDESTKGNALGQILGTISIDGNVALAKSIDTQDRKSIQGNNSQRTIVQNTTTSLADVLGGVRKKSEEICRGKRRSSIPILGSINDQVICLDFATYSTSNRLVIDGGTPTEYNTRTFVVKNADVVIQGSMVTNASANIFIDNGNLLLSNPSGTPLQYFDNKGYMLPNITNHAAEAFALKGNYIINGLVLGFDGTTIGTFGHKTYLHGKLAALNTPVDPTAARIKQVEAIPASEPHKDKINYAKAFIRQCNVASSQGTDSTKCGTASDKHTFSPIIVIDNLYKSPRY